MYLQLALLFMEIIKYKYHKIKYQNKFYFILMKL